MDSYSRIAAEGGPLRGRFRVGEWQVEPTLGCITRDGVSRHLEPKVMAVLVCLARAQNAVISKQHLIEEVWKDTFVTDDVLTRCIAELRFAFGDDARNPAIIQTIPKQGYRLLLKFEPQDRAVSTSGTRRWVMVAVSVLAVSIAGFAFVPSLRNRLLGRKPIPQINSIAVLPLKNLSGDPEQEYFADGMTEELITDLSKISALKVISRTSAMQFKHKKQSLPDIARQLNVDALIEGAVVREGNQVRVTVQLVEGATDRHLWAENYQREMHGILALQSEIAKDIADEVKARLSPDERSRLTKAHPVDPAAHELYIKGRDQLNRRRYGSPEEVLKARDYFEQSLREDPTYAPAYSGLSDAYLNLANRDVVPRQEALALAKAAALKALELDESLAEAHVSLAESRELERDWAGADVEFRRALELNANYAHAHHWYSQFLSEVGRHDEAIAEIRRAFDVDPLSPATWTPGDALYMARRYDEAIAYARRMIELDPNEPGNYRTLVFAYKAKGDLDRHMEAWGTYVLLMKFETPETVAATMRLYAGGGMKATARELLPKAEKEEWGLDELARIHVVLGQHDEALRCLELAVEQGGVPWLKVDPYWDPLRADPRFQKLLRRMNFPDT